MHATTKTLATAAPAIHVRWLIRRDMPEVLEIERACFPSPWTECDFVGHLRNHNVIGMVALHGSLDANGFLQATADGVLGFMIYELHKRHLQLTNIAVHPSYQRKGVGRALLTKLRSKLHQQRRTRIETEVRERNLGAQLFFRTEEFVCTESLRNWYEDTNEDAYFFRHCI